jgi:ketosteroid isomerase-like protein
MKKNPIRIVLRPDAPPITPDTHGIDPATVSDALVVWIGYRHAASPRRDDEAVRSAYGSGLNDDLAELAEPVDGVGVAEGRIPVTGIEQFVDAYRLALDAFFRGDPEPAKRLYSHRDDVCLNNPFGPPARGWGQVDVAMSQAAINYREGRALGFDRVAEFVTGELACIVEVEHYEAKVGGSGDQSTIDLRVTTLLRPEDGTWMVIHRHADPITSPRPASTVIAR